MARKTELTKRLVWGCVVFLVGAASATENAPRLPFAQWAQLPRPGQLRVTAFYQESESYHIWVKDDYQNVTWKSPNGERYGIDITQGFVSLDYGIRDRLALDINIGYTTVGWRYFSNYGPQGRPQSTDGLMDSSLGVRLQLAGETDQTVLFAVPDLVFRAGAVLPGSFDKDFPFAPGTRSAAIEPSLFMRKHFGWPGLGVYTDVGFRWNRTTANDQWLLGIGLFYQVKGWEFDVGYRRMHSVAGDDIKLTRDNRIWYPRGVREIYDAVEVGFSYTTPVRQFRYGFWSRTVVDGSNTDGKFWLGGYVSIPFTVCKPQSNNELNLGSRASLH